MAEPRIVPGILITGLWIAAGRTHAAGAIDGEVVRSALNPSAIALFLAFVGVTLFISWWASQRTRTSGEFYTAGGQITGMQNGAAIAGDFMSAASFLGVTGLMFAGGFDGLIFGIGAFAGWPLMLFLFSERVRNLGRYTFTDVVSLRLEGDSTRVISVFSTITIVLLYLIAQMVGAGKLVELLFGLPYNLAVALVSVLVIIYVAFGGMLATTWVQIVKAILLLAGITLMALLLLIGAGFDFDVLLEASVNRHPAGERMLQAGTMIGDPVQVATILVAMMFGTLGLPHVLMRLFTVPGMKEARRSAFYASAFIGYFYLLMVIVGFSAAGVLYAHPEFLDPGGQPLGGSNMTAIHLASAIGGEFLMAFVSAVAFATILAVVAGLTVSASAAIAHDLYSQVLCQGRPDPEREMLLTRLTTLVLGLLAIGLGILFQQQNIAYIATMPMVVAASVNFPVLLLSLYWPGLTTRGALAGAVVGLLSSVGLTIIGPQVWVAVLGFEQALFPYNYPALFTMPLTFAAIWLASRYDRSARGVIDRDNYHALLWRSEFGPRT
jgi:cation/acetate symporter